MQKQSITNRVLDYIPAIAIAANYDKSSFKSDLIAGLTVAVMLIPQGMAYAMLAGLPPIMGLYASIVPLVIYAIFGTSRQLAVGPVAIVSLMTAASIGAVAEQNTDQYLMLAIMLAMMVGLIQLALGLMRFGFIVNFLSHPVISGFTSAAALIIGFSQLKHLLGINIPRSQRIDEILLNAFSNITDVHLATLLIGISGVIILILIKKWKPLFPGALLIVILSTFVVWAFGLDQTGVKIVGDVPSGFPTPSLPEFDAKTIGILLPTAIAISLISYMESISVAKVFARKNKYEIKPDQELIGLGMANIFASFFKAFPVTGGFSRTAVNAQAGAQTNFAALVTAGCIALALLFLTPLFYYLPKAILGAIIVVAIVSLIDVAEVKHLYKVKKSDLAFLVLTFTATLTIGIEEGIIAGIIASLLWFIYKSSRPHFAVLGKLPGTQVYRNLERFPEAETFKGIVILRIDSQFYFGNSSFLKSIINDQIESSTEELRAIIISATGINQLDASADSTLHEVLDDLESRNIKLIFSDLKGPVRDVMEKSNLENKIGEKYIFMELHQAVEFAKNL